MKIGVILNPYGEKNPSGMGVFMKNLVRELIACGENDTYYLFIRGNHDASEYESLENVKIIHMPDTVLWKDIALIKNKDIDVWFYNNLGLPLILKPKKNLAIALDFWSSHKKKALTLKQSIMDVLIRITHHRALERASLVSCISKATKDDLHSLFKDIPRDKVLVNMSGFTKVCEEYEGIDIKNLPKDYYFVVGVMKPRKNQLTAVKAFNKAKESGMKTELVLAGKGVGSYYEEVMREVESSKFKDDIIYLDYISNEQLATLYKNARALVFPSHFEGFGMPILEAMSCGTPVIASSNSAAGEVAGDAALKADSSDVRGFAEAMNKFQSEEEREEFIKKGNARATEFSWKKTAMEYHEILKKLNVGSKP